MNTNNCKWSYTEHIAAIKKIYPKCEQKLQQELKDYVDMMKKNRFDDFDEHLMLQSICEGYFKIPMIYSDRIYMQNNEYKLDHFTIR